jgi:hypothetical protein
VKQIRCLGELFEPEAEDNDSRLSKELSQETVARGRPKALCYEDILLMVVRHPQTGEDVLAMSIKFIHHKGADNKPKPYDPPLFSALANGARQDHFLLHHDKKADLFPYHHRRQARSSRRRVPGAEFDQCQTGLSDEEPGPVKCTPFRWKKEWPKRPAFRQCAIISDEPLQYHRLKDDMARQSLDSGWTNPTEAGNAQNSRC